MDYIHVVPVNDLRSHDDATHCWCNPDVDGKIVVHNSMDEREKYETGERVAS